MELYDNALHHPQELATIIAKYGIVYPKPQQGYIHPLQRAIRFNLIESVKLLLHIDNVDFIGDKEYDAVDEAADCQNMDVLRLLNSMFSHITRTWPLYLAIIRNNFH